MAGSAVITGAGSGVGQAIAISLAQAGWRVALVGRREAALQETGGMIGSAEFEVYPCDISQPVAVEAMAQAVQQKFGSVELLVNAAGTNAPRRSLASVSYEDYHRIVDTNLEGAYLCVQAFLPSMRERHTGTIINVVSDAGLKASPKAGVAYVVSKFGMAGLTQAINAEERGNGVRACSVFPGDINTPILDLRPSPPSAEARQGMLQPQDIADCVMMVVNLPPRAIVEELVIRPA